MRAAIWSNVRGSIRPWAAYWDTSSRMELVSLRTARRTVVLDEAEAALEKRRAAGLALGRLCTQNVYIIIPPGARADNGSAGQGDLTAAAPGLIMGFPSSTYR